METRKSKFTPIVFSTESEPEPATANDIYLSLDEVIVKRGIQRVPKSYEKGLSSQRSENRGGAIIRAMAIPRLKNDPTRDEPADETDEVIGIECYVNLGKGKRKLQTEEELMDEDFPSAIELDKKRVKVLYDDLEPIPEEEDEDAKDIFFGPISSTPPKPTILKSLPKIQKTLNISPVSIVRTCGFGVDCNAKTNFKTTAGVNLFMTEAEETISIRPPKVNPFDGW